MLTLRPPLPPPLSHEGIRFISASPGTAEPSPEEVVALAFAVNALLPPGDLTSVGGRLVSVSQESVSAWLLAARLEAVSKDYT